ncbi:Rho termination factor N-terminal domain-containing protein [Desulfitobacterium hafniense]|nr:Rho termination factor N-terminal domain-containing protein [Desulfitobacterium hafniense]
MKALEPVFLNGLIIDAGNEFSCSPEFSRKLIEAKTAELAQPERAPEKNFESMTKEELLNYAEELAIDGINSSNKKSEIIEAILKAAESDGV